MKIHRWIIIPAIAATLLTTLGATRSVAEQVTLAPHFQPITLRGMSGGVNSSNCGKIAASPNVILQVTDNISSMRVRVQSSGQPTLLIDGPKGRACIPADSTGSGSIEIPGFWEKGLYTLYIGDRAGESHDYTFSVSNQ